MIVGAIGKGAGAYSPDPINVSVGDTVVWTNNDSGIAHTVTSGTSSGFSNSPLSSPTLSSGQTFQFTFNNAGTFTYGCTIHGKQGTVNTLYTAHVHMDIDKIVGLYMH
jgi:plastocyanin